MDLGVDDLGIFPCTSKEIDTSVVNRIPCNNSAIYADWITPVRFGYFDGNDIDSKRHHAPLQLGS